MRYSIGLFALVFVFSSASPSWAAFLSDAEYVEEIKQEVLFPCYRYMMQLNRLEGYVTVEQFYEYMKATDRVTRLAEAKLLEQIRRKSRRAREKVYQAGRNSCIVGVVQGRVR